MVNGNEEFVGSDTGKLSVLLQKVGSGSPGPEIQVQNVLWKDDKLQLQVLISNPKKGDVLNLALVAKATENLIPRGENNGITLKGSNVVGVFKQLDSPTFINTIELNQVENSKKEDIDLITFIQDKKTHEVISVGALGF